MRIIEELRVYLLYDFMIKTVSQILRWTARKSIVNDDKTVIEIFVCLVNNFEMDK